MGLVVPEDQCCIQEPSLLTQDAKCLFHQYIKADLHNLSADMTPAKWFSCLFHVQGFFIRRGVHPFFSEGAGGGTMGPPSRKGNREADGSKKLSYYLQHAAALHVDFVCLESACVSASQCVRTGYLHVCLLHPACAVLIHPTLFLHAGRYMSRLWRRQQCPVLSTPN